MPKFEVIKGVVGNKQDRQVVSGRMHNGRGHVRTKHHSTFVIDGKAAELNGSGGMYFNDGDEIVAVGQSASDGVLQVMGFKNFSNGSTHQGATIIPTIMGISCIGLGVMTFFLIITPILFIPLGLIALWGSYKNVQANKVLKSVS